MLEQMFESVQLTEEQRRAATYQGGNLLIVAGTLVGASGMLLTRLMSSAMGRSLENLPEAATFRIAFRVQPSALAYDASIR